MAILWILHFLNFIKINILILFLNMGIPDVNVAYSDLLHTYFFIPDLLHTYFFQIWDLLNTSFFISDLLNTFFLFQIYSIHIFFYFRFAPYIFAPKFHLAPNFTLIVPNIYKIASKNFKFLPFLFINPAYFF